MPKITHPGVAGHAEVNERTLPFWLRGGWELADGEPEPVDDLEAGFHPSTVTEAVADDPAVGQSTSTPTTEE